jgi:Flp pilus assembly protein TadB
VLDFLLGYWLGKEAEKEGNPRDESGFFLAIVVCLGILAAVAFLVAASTEPLVAIVGAVLVAMMILVALARTRARKRSPPG